jgi:hypothetical protein
MPAHKPNTGPVDLLYLLKRRRVSFERWCHEHGISTQAQYQDVKARIQAEGEFLLSPEMDALAATLDTVAVVPEETPEAPAEPVTVPEEVASPSEEDVVVVTDSPPKKKKSPKPV